LVVIAPESSAFNAAALDSWFTGSLANHGNRVLANSGNRVLAGWEDFTLMDDGIEIGS
jgi:hypothetical protein